MTSQSQEFSTGDVSRQMILKLAAWNPQYACFVFADGSTGIFNDVWDGAQHQTRSGEPVWRFVPGEPLPS